MPINLIECIRNHLKKWSRPKDFYLKQIGFFEYLKQTDGRQNGSSSSQGLQNEWRKRRTHGGVPSRGRRKLARPFAKNKWIHLILKSEKAKGPWSLLAPRNKIFIQKLIRQKAKKFGVQVDHWVNVGNHVHIKLKSSNRLQFQKFLKATTCLIARHVTGAKKGKPMGKFWQGLAFTRILTSYLEERQLNGYFRGNEIEALFGTSARESFLKQFNHWLKESRRKEMSTA